MRLVGGEFLLNLTNISLGLTAGEVSISDAEILSQLLELRNFIDDKRDFTKGFKDLKPVLVQYRSSASKIDGVVPCNLSFNTDALHLSIAGYSVQADGTPITLRINVVYEWTDYVGYTIKTAKLEATNEFNALSIKGDSIIENMEGYSFAINNVTGTTIAYVGCVKNGNKLTFVVAGSVVKSADTPYNAELGTFSIPVDIANKLYPLTEGILTIDIKNIGFFVSSDLATTPISKNAQFAKHPTDADKITLKILGFSSNLTNDSKYYFRWESTFLLSDNLVPAGE